MTTTPDPHVCTLTPEGARARLPQARALTERLRTRHRTDGRLQLHFVDDGDTGALVEEFVRDESRCCTSFDFTTRHVGHEVVLELTAPEGAGHLLDVAMAAFDPSLDDDQRLALHGEVARPVDPAPDSEGRCGC